MTPEERAEVLFNDLSCHPANHTLSRWLIAAAIRAAENEALERAAQVANKRAEKWAAHMKDETTELNLRQFCANLGVEGTAIAAAIRALKVEPSE